MPDRGRPQPPRLHGSGGGGRSPNPLTTCRYCGASIFFRLTDKGKWQPISRESGQPHFAECPPWVALRAKHGGAA